MEKEKQHKNDMYGNIDARNESDEGVLPPIPAATVVLLREAGGSYEVLMLKKIRKSLLVVCGSFLAVKLTPKITWMMTT